ncbi:MAG TPA: PEGA domain-containing protein [Vicinamibacterales bacterium]|nr:PEGA domain-containing protein [Vicinamibacterales bacterium]
MSTVPVSSERPEAPLFSDGLGDRVVAADGATGDLLQILRLRGTLLSVPSFEFALRERTARLANFRHAYYARVRRIDRYPGGLAVVSDHTEGTRLSDILRVAEERRLQLDINASLYLLRQLVPAVALLHENARDVAHGLIAPERLMVTPHARLVIGEHVLGSAVEQLQYSRDRLWQELRVALPPSAGAPRFDHRADVTGVGLVALALIIGRPLRADDYPQRIPLLLNDARARSSMGEEEPLPVSLRTWLARAMQLDVRRAFTSATEAMTAFEELLAEDTGLVASPVALEAFLSRYIGALLDPAPVPVAPPSPAVVYAPAAMPMMTSGPAASPAPASALPVSVRQATASPTLTPPAGTPRPAPTPASGTSRPATTPPSGILRSQMTPPAGTPRPSTPPAGTPRPPLVPQAGVPHTLTPPAGTPRPPAVPGRDPRQAPPSSPRPELTPAAGTPRVPTPPPAAAPPSPPPVRATPPVPSPVFAAAPPTVPQGLTPAAGTPRRLDLPTGLTPPMGTPRPVVSPTAQTPATAAPTAQPDAPRAGFPATGAHDITELIGSLEGTAARDRDRDQLFTADERAPEPASKSARPRATRRLRVAAVVAALVFLGGAGVFAARMYYRPAPPSPGTLSVQTNPPGVQVFVDGVMKGQTPAHVSVTAGAHILELRGRGVPRVIPITVTPGAEVSQYLELPQTPTLGSLLVQSDPEGARVSIDGADRGVAPLSVADLTPGEHEVVLAGDGGTVRQKVVIQAGVTASVLAPMATVAAGPVSGWVSVKAPVTIEIREGGRLLGTSDTDRLMMASGRHQLDLVNETLGYHSSRAVVVPAGKVARLDLTLPQGVMNINATPWAEVWIDGKRVGETPIGNLAVPIGPHEVVFKHPQLGEKHEAVSVTLNAPVRLSVDMK